MQVPFNATKKAEPTCLAMFENYFWLSIIKRVPHVSKYLASFATMMEVQEIAMFLQAGKKFEQPECQLSILNLNLCDC